MATRPRMEFERFDTTTPRRVTSVGSDETARCTRLLTSIAAWSASVPSAKVTVSDMVPLALLADCM
ncbi:hypothetical protein D3C87_1841800 [compost metagenome]